MKYLDRYPIIVTERRARCRDFWARHLGFAVVFENEWVVYMQAEGASIAFMAPEHPSWPPGPEGYVAGISLELEVAASALAEVRETGAEPDYPLTAEPFGQRRFSLRDPSGLWINVVQQL